MLDLRTVTPPSEIRDYAFSLIHRFGPGRAAELMGLSRHAVMAIALGIDVMPGSLALAREAMRARGVML